MTINALLQKFPQMGEMVSYKNLSGLSYYLEDIKDAETNFVTEDEYWNFCIENPDNRNILFVENELCIMRSINTKKCDWTLFESNNSYFIESKDVKPRSRNKERKEATKQLAASIEYYTSNLDFSNEKIYAVVCFKSKSKIIKAGDQARKVFFKEKYNSEYFEANVIEI
jgi:hypothetical protein